MGKEYYDLLNRKTTMDKVGDAFTEQANSMQPRNVGQRREQALMRGLGAGFGINPAREAKLRELEEQSKELSTLDYGLKMSVGKVAKRKADNENFFYKYQNDFAVLEGFKKDNNEEAIKVMLPTFIENYTKETGEDLGTFVGYQNNKAYFDRKGKVIGVDVTDITQTVIPESQRENYPSLLTYNTRERVLNTIENEKLKSDYIKAQIAASNANVRSSDAHAKLYESQAEKAKSEAKNPPMSDEQKILFKADVDSNKEYLKETGKKIIADKMLVQTLDETESMLVEAAKKGQVGSDLLSIAKRKWGKYISGNNKEMTVVDMAKAAYFARVKEAGGSNPSTTEFLTALETIPNTDKNLLASLSILRKDKLNALNSIYRFNNIEKNLRNNDYQGSPYDENVIGFNEDEFNSFVKDNSSKRTITVRKKDKSTGIVDTIEIPIDDYENVYKDGYSFVGK